MITATQMATTTAMTGTIGPAMEMAMLLAEARDAAGQLPGFAGEGTDIRGIITDADRFSKIVRGATRDDVARMNAVLGPSASQVAATGLALADMRMAFREGVRDESGALLGEFMHEAEPSVRAYMAEVAARNVFLPVMSQIQYLAPNALLALYRDRSNFDKGTRESIAAAVQGSSNRWLRFRAALHDLWQALKA
ncbi:MAG: hypothetical protein Q8P84_08930 [Deltaproteobacteria bacterium]|nr:hypothetical protein [Deltaproteobacteria bacterium]